MDKRHLVAVLLAVTLIGGCTHKEQSSSSTSNESGTNQAASASASPETSASMAVATNGPTFATFHFSDVALTSSAAPILRLGFDLKNNSQDPLLCDASEFSIQLADGTTIAADTGAENSCTPDTVDPGETGKVVMFFDLKSAPSGPVTLLMSVNNAVVGRGTADVH